LYYVLSGLPGDDLFLIVFLATHTHTPKKKEKQEHSLANNNANTAKESTNDSY